MSLRIRSFVLGAALLSACAVSTSLMAAEMQSERVAVGQEAPEVALPGAGDASHTLSALRGEKNAVLVFFRGAW